MNINKEIVKPFKGLGDIEFTFSLNDTKKYLKDNKISFNIDHLPNKDCTPEVAWDIIKIGKNIKIFFAKSKMFEIYVENSFEGQLENGIKIGDSINEALKIDDSIYYNEDAECYESLNGYWLKENTMTNTIVSITIFINEVLDDNVFYSYEWC